MIDRQTQNRDSDSCTWCDDWHTPGCVGEVFALELCPACTRARAAEPLDWPDVKFFQKVFARAMREGATAMRLVPIDARSMVLQVCVKDYFADWYDLNRKVAFAVLRRLRSLSGAPELGRGADSGEFEIETRFGKIIVGTQSFDGSPTVNLSLSPVLANV